MAANRILDELKAFSYFLTTGFKYNVQVFPDTITAAALLFSLLFQSPPLAALGGSLVLLNFIHPLLADFMTRVVNNTLGPEIDPSLCSGHFPGISYERLWSMSSEKTFGALQNSAWPSFYTTFLGFLVGWIGVLPFIYSKEIEASPKRQTASILGLVVLSIVLGLGIVFRVASGCDTFFGTLIGLLAGGLVGFVLVSFLAWISDRRITNMLGFPLIRDRAPDGKPIYVCQRNSSN